MTKSIAAIVRRADRVFLHGGRPDMLPALAITSAVLPSQIPTLDGWRAIAILLVLFCHSGDSLFGDGGLLPNALLARAAPKGGFGSRSSSLSAASSSQRASWTSTGALGASAYRSSTPAARSASCPRP